MRPKKLLKKANGSNGTLRGVFKNKCMTIKTYNIF